MMSHQVIDTSYADTFQQKWRHTAYAEAEI